MRQYKIKIRNRLWAIGYGLWILVIAYSLSPLACLNGFAEDKVSIDSNQPITITSDNMEASKKENVAIFRGNVKAQQKDYTLYSKELHVYYGDSKAGSGNREIKEIIATGDVKIIQTNRTATGEKAIYNRTAQTIVLTGNAQVEQECDTVAGDKITIFLAEDKSIVEGGGDSRVKAIVFPKDEKTNTKCK